MIAGFIAFAYLCGSIPFGLLIARWKSGKDVRTVGSGNIGATNVARAAGRGAAIATLVLDALKGLLPVLLAARVAASPASMDHPKPWLAAACAVAAVAGHCFPFWLRFRGGKGVATGLGVALALAPWGALAGALVWLVFFKLLRISSVGSLAGVTTAVLVAVFTAGKPAVLGLAAVALLVIIRHAGNIQRLLARQENQGKP